MPILDTSALDNFLTMGGYAAYVWPAYILAFLLLGGMFIISLKHLRRTETLLQELSGHEPPPFSSVL